MQTADLLAVATPAAQPSAPPHGRRPDDAADFARTLGEVMEHGQGGDGRCGTSEGAAPTGEGRAMDGAGRPDRPDRPGRLELHDRPGRPARAAWAAFLQDIRGEVGFGAHGGDRLAAALVGGGPVTARAAPPAGILGAGPKPAPDAFTEALDALGAAIRAAVQDPAANPAAPGQLPAAVQTALDAAIAAAPPALVERIQAFAGRLTERMAAIMADGGETGPPGHAGDAAGAASSKPPPIAQAVLDAIAQADRQPGLPMPLAPERERPTAAAQQPKASANPDVSPTAPAQAGAPASATQAAGAAPAGPASDQSQLAAAPAGDGLALPAADAADGLAPAAPQAAAPADNRAATVAAVRMTPETVNLFAAAMARRMEGGSTRFDLELHPSDLGRVDVRLSIDKDGRIAAQMAFDNPVAAADMRGRADELRRQLADAGFQVASEDLSFTDRESSGFERQARGETAADPEAARKRAFHEAERTARLAEDAQRLHGRAVLGVDMRV